jgi:undecaprenyl-diphosphatase
MTYIEAIILGIVEGITEFLPISSTAHLIVVSKLLALEQTDALFTFQIAVQLGAILAVVCFFYKKFFNPHLLIKLAVAFIPTGIVGVLVYPYIKHLFENTWTIVVTLFLGGIIILLVERSYSKKKEIREALPPESISYKNALLLGIFQALAIIPGTSRSGATIVGGLLLGLHRATLTEFTFLLAVPTMSVATLYSVYKNIHILSNASISSTLVLGMITSFVVAMLVIKLVLAYIKKHSFVIFAWYRIALAIIIALFII